MRRNLRMNLCFAKRMRAKSQSEKVLTTIDNSMNSSEFSNILSQKDSMMNKLNYTELNSEFLKTNTNSSNQNISSNLDSYDNYNFDINLYKDLEDDQRVKLEADALIEQTENMMKEFAINKGNKTNKTKSTLISNDIYSAPKTITPPKMISKSKSKEKINTKASNNIKENKNKTINKDKSKEIISKGERMKDIAGVKINPTNPPQYTLKCNYSSNINSTTNSTPSNYNLVTQYSSPNIINTSNNTPRTVSNTIDNNDYNPKEIYLKNKQIRTLEKELKEKEQQLKLAQDKIKAKNDEIDKLNEALTIEKACNIKADNIKLQRKIASLEKTIEDNKKTYEHIIDEMKTKNSLNLQSNKSNETKITSLEKANKNLLKDKEILNKKISELETKIKQSKEKFEMEKKAKNNMQQNIDSLKTKLSNLCAIIRSLYQKENNFCKKRENFTEKFKEIFETPFHKEINSGQKSFYENTIPPLSQSEFTINENSQIENISSILPNNVQSANLTESSNI